MQLIIIFLFAVLFSAFGTVVGFGGGIFMIPFLVIVFKVPINIAVGSIILALFPGSLISTFYNFRAKKIDYLAGIILEIPTVIGTVAGSFLTSILPVDILKIIFSVFILITGIYTFKRGGKSEGKNSSKENVFYKLNKVGPRIIKRTTYGAYRISYSVALFFGLAAGLMAGLFGIGGGFMKTPIMVNVFNIPPSIAAATALFMIVFTSLTGSISHFLLGQINITYSIPIVLGFIIGAFAGKQINFKLPENVLGKLIGIALILAGIAIAVNTFFIK